MTNDYRVSLVKRAQESYQKSDSPVYRQICLNVVKQLNKELRDEEFHRLMDIGKAMCDTTYILMGRNTDGSFNDYPTGAHDITIVKGDKGRMWEIDSQGHYTLQDRTHGKD